MCLLTLCLVIVTFICHDTLGLVLFVVKGAFFLPDSPYRNDLLAHDGLGLIHFYVRTRCLVPGMFSIL